MEDKVHKRMVVRDVSTKEEAGLARWSARFLGECVRWLQNRGLALPTQPLERLQNAQKVADFADLAEFIAGSATSAKALAPARTEDPLSRELERDVSRSAFPLTLERMPFKSVTLVYSASNVAPVFCVESRSLYLPTWSKDQLPRSLFVPNDSFPSERPASIAWLLLDAFVFTDRAPLTSVQDFYGFE